MPNLIVHPLAGAWGLPSVSPFCLKLDAYLRLVAEEENIIAFRADEYYWRDLGRPENIKQAERDVESGKLVLSQVPESGAGAP